MQTNVTEDACENITMLILNRKLKRNNNVNPNKAKHTKNFKTRVYFYREFLINMSQVLDATRDTDLLNIRDEILGDINQFLYLMTFNK